MNRRNHRVAPPRRRSRLALLCAAALLPLGAAATATGARAAQGANTRPTGGAGARLTHVGTIGSPGEAQMYPAGAAVDASGNVYVADIGNDAVEKYGAGTSSLVWKVGVRGTPIGGSTDSFVRPAAVATDGTYVYVADSGDHAVQVLKAADGTFVQEVTGFGSGQTFSDPVGVHTATVPGVGSMILVSDAGTGNVYVFSPSFSLVGTITPPWKVRATRDAVADSSGNVYVVDAVRQEVDEYSLAGTLLAHWGGSRGPSCQRLSQPAAIDYDTTTGDLYVASRGFDQVRVFDAGGSCVGVGGSSSNIIGTKAATETSPGLWQLSSVAVGGPDDLVYASDLGGLRILAYTQSGQLATQQPQLGDGQYPAAGGLNDPAGVAVDTADRYVFALNTNNSRVERFGLPAGDSPFTFGASSSRLVSAALNDAQGIAFDPAADSVWVANTGNNTLEEFSTSGTLMLTYPAGKSSTELAAPEGVAAGPSGTVYVADTGHSRVVAYSVSGTALTELWSEGAPGSGSDQFAGPTGLVYDATQSPARLLVADTANSRIVSLDPSTGAWNGVLPIPAGTTSGSLLLPRGVSVDPLGNIWVADTGNQRVQELSSAGTFEHRIGGLGSAANKFDAPLGIGTDDDGNVYVADSANNRVQVLGLVRPTTVLRTFAPIFMGRQWNLTESQAVALAQQNDLIVAQAYVFQPYLAQMHTANRDVRILTYVNGTYDINNPSGTAYPASWYAHDAQGNRITSTNFGEYLMDLRNPAWASTVAQECTSMLSNSGYDGCFVDSLGTSAFYPGYDTALPIDPTTGAVWTETDWLQATSGVADAVKAAIPSLLVVTNGLGNGAAYFASPAPTSVLLAPSGEGMAQTFIRPQNGSVSLFRPESKWQEDVDMLVNAEAQGDSVLATTQLFVPANAAQTTQWHRFALASFLLGAGGLSFFSFVPANTNAAISAYSPLDHMDIGTPLAHYAQTKNGLFMRAYSRGVVVVNPTGSALKISLGGTYRNLSGRQVTAETLQADTADIFLAV